ELPVEREVSVLVVPGDRESQVLQVHSDLVGAAGPQLRLQQREPVVTPLQPEQRPRGQSTAVDVDPPFPCSRKEFVQGQLDVAERVAPTSCHQSQVQFAHAPRTNLFVQSRECAAFLGQQQHARGIAVKPVNQLKKAQFRPFQAQLLDHAPAYAAAAV